MATRASSPDSDASGMLELSYSSSEFDETAELLSVITFSCYVATFLVLREFNSIPLLLPSCCLFLTTVMIVV